MKTADKIAMKHTLGMVGKDKYQDILNAMEEYASQLSPVKQESDAVEFAEWLDKINFHRTSTQGEWLDMITDKKNWVYKNTEQLHQLFLKEKGGNNEK